MNEQEILCFADIQAEEVKWLWYPYIPYGKITILQGDPGCGKTMAVLSLAALLSKGESLPFEEATREPINILYQTSEDGIADTIKPRLESAGANCTRIKIINEEKRALTFDDPRLEQSVLQENARLLILDPLSAYIGPTVSMNQANEVRCAFRSLYAMAQRTKCAVLIVAHMNKMSGINALYRTSGSIDIAGAVRSILTVTRYQRSPTQRVLVPVKSNLAVAGPALLFELSDHVEWLWQLDEDAESLLNGCDSLPEAPTKQQQVEEELPRLLENGPVSNQEIIQHFKNKGIQDRTVNLVKGRLTFLEGISWKITRRLFRVDARSSCEKKVIRLARQTPLSCAEIIKSIEMDIRRLKDGYDVLDKLYDDNDLNCDNFAQAVREYRCSREVITAVANLYLRQQIMLDTY